MRTRREQAVVYSIVNEPYEPVTAIRAGVPLELDRILSKALAKKPEERYPAQRRGARRSEALTVGAKIGPTPLRSVRAGQGSGSKLVEIRRCQRSGTAPELPESGNFRAADGAMMEFGGCPRSPGGCPRSPARGSHVDRDIVWDVVTREPVPLVEVLRKIGAGQGE
jgi:hypothetical protein